MNPKKISDIIAIDCPLGDLLGLTLVYNHKSPLISCCDDARPQCIGKILMKNFIKSFFHFSMKISCPV